MGHLMTKAWLLPIVGFVLVPGCYIITYFWSVFVTRNVSAYFPMVSETGTIAPDNIFFSLVMNAYAVVFLISCWIRNGIFKQQLQTKLPVGKSATFDRWWHRIRIALWKVSIVTLLCSGLMVANNEYTGWTSGHNVAALVMLISIVTLNVQDLYLAYSLRIVPIWLSVLRAVIQGMQVLDVGLFMWTTVKVYPQLKNARRKSDQSVLFGVGRYAEPNSSVHDYFISWAVTEWLAAFLYGFYSLTLVYEFRRVTLTKPRVLWSKESVERTLTSVLQNGIEVAADSV